MKIGVIQAGSQAGKNRFLYDTVTKYAPEGAEVINFGCTPEETGYSYVDISVLAGLLLESGSVSFIVTGCSSGQGMMLACNSMSGVLCGYAPTPKDAYLFAQINDGNCISLPLGEDYTWKGYDNCEKTIAALFCKPFGQGYPEHEAERKRRDTIKLKKIRKAGQVSPEELLKTIDSKLIRHILNKQDVIRYIFQHGSNEITGCLREMMKLRIGLVSYECRNRDIAFNIEQIRLVMERSQGKADLLCFGEAFLQGFDSLSWNYETDSTMAAELTSEVMNRLREWTVLYGISLLTGYIEKEHDKLYSSCVVLSEGRTVHNYRRISEGWKEYTKTDAHYCEGTDTSPFQLYGRTMQIALCGDLWEYPERFRTEHTLLWPVYVNYTVAEWNEGAIDEYAEQASEAAENVLMINPLDHDPVSHGGSFHFHKGHVLSSIPFDEEQILYVEI